MKKVALVTYNKQPKLFDSDNLLVKPFEKHGFIAEAAPWDKKGVDWKKYDLVILCSPWNYHLQVPEFLDWIEYLEIQKIKLWNPPNIIRWNMNKKYLLELSNMGIPIIPSLLFNKKTKNSVKEIISGKGWKEIVIKPVFGASAYKIAKIKAEYLEIQEDCDFIIQPFMKEINLEGEYSFIYFNKQFSHALLKKPKKNEYRINRAFGGIELKIKPTSNLLSQTQQVLVKIKTPLLYARIDGLNIDGQFQLMELELIEPYLFFEKNTESAEKFVKSAIELSNKYQPD